MRSCYSTYIKPWKDKDDRVQIRWYFVDDNTPHLPFPTCYVSGNWDPDKQFIPDCGELPSEPRTWVDGNPPPWFGGNLTLDGWQNRFVALNGATSTDPLYPTPMWCLFDHEVAMADSMVADSTEGFDRSIWFADSMVEEGTQGTDRAIWFADSALESE